MPSFDDQIATGEGVYRVGIEIAGWPVVYVSDTSLEGAVGDGRTRVAALEPDGLLVSTAADLIRGDIVQQGSTIELAEDYEGSIAAILAARPTARAWLTVDATDAETVINPTSIAAFDQVSGPGDIAYLYMGTETLSYESIIGGTTFGSVTRGIWGSTAQYHYTGDGANIPAEKITDAPETLVGRRVSIYMWGEGDAPDEGVERWRGVIRDAPEYRAGRWSFGVEPIGWILDQPLGGDYSTPTTIRGIYYPSSSCFEMYIYRHDGATALTDAYGDVVAVQVAGFFEDQAAFCDAVNAAIVTQTSAFSWDVDTELRVDPLGDEGYRISYTVGSSNAYWITLESYRHTAELARTDTMITPGQWTESDGDGEPAGVMAVGLTYTTDVAAPVPRSFWGERSTERSVYGLSNVHSTDSSWPANRFYVGGTAALTTDLRLSLSTREAESVREFMNVEAVDTSLRMVTVSMRGNVARPQFDDVEFTLLKTLASGDVGDLIDALITKSPEVATLGTLPLVTASDFERDYTELRAAISSTSWSAREWVAGGTTLTLREMIVPELVAVGCYLATTSTGALSIKRLRTPLTTDIYATTIDSSVMVGGLPSLSMTPHGQVREVVYRQGWEQIEGEYTGTAIRVRSLVQTGGVLEVTPKSIPVVQSSLEYTIEEAYTMATTVIGLFGRPYRVATLDCSMAIMDDCQIGSNVVVDTDFLPSVDGTMGMTTAGIVTGYEWTPYEGRGRVTVLLTDLETGGYSPCFVVALVGFGSGTGPWTLTVNLLSGSSGAIYDYYEIGDRCRLIERDTENPVIMDATIASNGSENEVQVTTDSTWTPGSSVGGWYLAFPATADASTTPGYRGWPQTAYAKIAGPDHRVELSTGDVDATEWAP